MKTIYFTFGQVHRHEHKGIIFDKDCVLEMKAKNSIEARKRMFKIFGDKWSFQYNKLPDMMYFPRGIIKLNSKI